MPYKEIEESEMATGYFALACVTVVITLFIVGIVLIIVL